MVERAASTFVSPKTAVSLQDVPRFFLIRVQSLNYNVVPAVLHQAVRLQCQRGQMGLVFETLASMFIKVWWILQAGPEVGEQRRLGGGD